MQFWCTRPARHTGDPSRSCERHASYLPCPSSVEVDYTEPKHGQIEDEKGDAKESTGVTLARNSDGAKAIKKSSEEVLPLAVLQMG